MTSELLVYLRLGFAHIADLRGYDHILFIVALTAMYPPRAWRRVLVLVTAFTVGHSLTLALATVGRVRADTAWVEFLIPLTILATALLDGGEVLRRRPGDPDPEPRGGRILKYVLALVFGLVHGLGFSTFLRAVLGGEGSVAVPLFAFNVGVELGQVAVVACVMTATWLATEAVGLSLRTWTLLLSAATGVTALALAAGRIPT